MIWEHQIEGSNPFAPTQSKPIHTSELHRLAFLLDKSVHRQNGQIMDKCVIFRTAINLLIYSYLLII